MTRTVRPASGLTGVVHLPADKSIAHRCALFAAIAEGRSHVVNFPDAADPQSTLSCLRQLGVEMSTDADGLLVIEGRGLHGLQPPTSPVDCGNSGTTMRLLSGILAGQRFDSELVGDASLSARPMRRIRDPLRSMGAEIRLAEGHAPITIHGRPLQGITYSLPVPSAQVKSCVLLAGLYADGETTVIEAIPSRDHTERMLGVDGIALDGKQHWSIQGGRPVTARTWSVPRDFSAAAFFLVAGSIVPGSALRLPGVGMNPTRTGLLRILRAMGADIRVTLERTVGGEPIADLEVRAAELTGVTVAGTVIPNLIDEIPILAVAAACAGGRTVIRDAAELRVKETDRIAAMAANLLALGVRVEQQPDGLEIEGGQPMRGASVDAFDDHRIAMSMGIAGLVASGTTVVQGARSADVSFPGFWEALESVRV